MAFFGPTRSTDSSAIVHREELDEYWRQLAETMSLHGFGALRLMALTKHLRRISAKTAVDTRRG